MIEPEESLFIIKYDVMSQPGKVNKQVQAILAKADLEIKEIHRMRLMRELVEKHYDKDDQWKQKFDQMHMENAKAEFNVDPSAVYKAESAMEIGEALYKILIDGHTGTRAIAMRVCGKDCVARLRALQGGLVKPAPDTLRGMFQKMPLLEAVVKKLPWPGMFHASNSVEAAKKELALFGFAKQRED